MPLDFRIYTGQAVTGLKGALDCPLFGEPISGVGTWLTPDKSQISLGADDRGEVSFVVNVPPGASAGDHLGFVFVDVAPASLDSLNAKVTAEALGEDKASFRVRVSTRFALAVVVRVPGAVTTDLSVDSVSKSFHEGKLGLKFTGLNSGNVYLKPQGRSIAGCPGPRVFAWPFPARLERACIRPR